MHAAGRVAHTLEWSDDEWNNIIRANMTGLWLVTKHACNLMHNAKLKGSVINISSINGLPRSQFLGGGLPYSASKAGVDAMTHVTNYLKP